MTRSESSGSHAQTISFSGSGYYWSNLGELPEIIEALAMYPLTKPVAWRWGPDDTAGRGPVLALELNQCSHRGGLQLRVEVADLHDSEQRVVAKLRTDYASLNALRLQLIAMRDRLTDEVHLAVFDSTSRLSLVPGLF